MLNLFTSQQRQSRALRRAWASVHHQAVQTLALSGPQVTALATQANEAEALALSNLERAFLEYAAQLKTLAAMCEEAAGHLNTGLAQREAPTHGR